MIEMNMIYDLVPGIDLQAYQEWAKKATGLVLQSPGLIEFRANRNVLGNPQVRATSVWKSLSDWANYTESAEWQELRNEMLAFATNVSASNSGDHHQSCLSLCVQASKPMDSDGFQIGAC